MRIFRKQSAVVVVKIDAFVVVMATPRVCHQTALLADVSRSSANCDIVNEALV